MNVTIDIIETYWVIVVLFGLVVSCALHGQEKTSKHNGWEFAGRTILMLPIIGRFFGWW